ncbi:hypothetical protein [Bradyrhizobium sp. DASA03007]|uniref:hypothetical protein n=1 Tax=unclassified Bradyrhizobium TaxID=2631580 RepID=UPI003F72304C
MEVRTTHDSLLRAFGLLMGRQRTIKQKFTYSPFGSAIHATRRLTKDENKAVDEIAAKLRKLDPNNHEEAKQYQALLKELSKLPVKFVPLKYEQRIDRSKSYRRAA